MHCWRPFSNVQIEKILKKFSGQGLFHAEFLLNRRKLCQQRVYNSYLWLLSSSYTDSSFSPRWSSMLTRHTTLEDPWKKLNKPLEHYFLKRKHLKNHWKRIKRIWKKCSEKTVVINCEASREDRLPNFQSTVKWIYNTQIVWSNFAFPWDVWFV